MSTWISVTASLPEVGRDVLTYGGCGIEVARLVNGDDDGPDCMGHDPGWSGMFAQPGRSFGAPEYQCPPQCPPSHWMPLPAPPALDDEGEPF